jgi:hypothetical protein
MFILTYRLCAHCSILVLSYLLSDSDSYYHYIPNYQVAHYCNSHDYCAIIMHKTKLI